MRIVRRTQTKPYQLQEIQGHLVACTEPRIWVPVLDRQKLIRSRGITHDALGRNAHVVSGDARLPSELRFFGKQPAFDSCIPVVGQIEYDRTFVFLQKAGSRHQRRNRYRERECVQSAILFPAVLVRDRAHADNKPQRTADHVRNFDIA